MYRCRIAITKSIVLLAAVMFFAPAIQAQGVYDITYEDVQKAKEVVNDPRPLYTELSPEKVMPPEFYKSLIYDIPKMKEVWAKVVGFKAPDVVGNIAPAIRPGKYTIADREKFKDLLLPGDYERFAPGGPPYIGNFSEIEVVPTRQYYWALPLAEATLKNAPNVRQKDDGYLDYASYVAGFPFPQPSGPHAAQQMVYNWEKRNICGDSYYLMTQAMGYQKELKNDFDSLMEMFIAKLEGRTLMEPYGYFDERAEANNESRATINCAFSPRDLYGNCFAMLSYSNPEKMDQPLMYLNVFRRVRKMSGTDTQDPMGGQDYIYEDGDGFNQKLSPDRYPYKYEVVEEREFLLPSYTMDGSGYLSTEDFELKDYKWERRPIMVCKLTQLDKNFIYSYRMMWFDKETLMLLHVENYDQKGRLYRQFIPRYVFFPKMGIFSPADVLARDRIDDHSMIQRFYTVPTEVGREDLSIQKMIRGR